MWGGTRWRSWLRHCATNREVVGSIPDGVIGIFHWHKPSGRTMALESIQPLKERSSRNISWGCKGGRCVELTLPLSFANCLEMWEPQPPGTLRDCPGLSWDCFTFYCTHVFLTIHHTMGKPTISSRSVHGQGFGKTTHWTFLCTCAHVILSLSVFRKLTNKQYAVIESLSVHIFFRRIPALTWASRNMSAISGTTRCI